jgi:hypothetical protein
MPEGHEDGISSGTKVLPSILTAVENSIIVCTLAPALHVLLRFSAISQKSFWWGIVNADFSETNVLGNRLTQDGGNLYGEQKTGSSL